MSSASAVDCVGEGVPSRRDVPQVPNRGLGLGLDYVCLLVSYVVIHVCNCKEKYYFTYAFFFFKEEQTTTTTKTHTHNILNISRN